MGFRNSLPFARGETGFQGESVSSLVNKEWEGMIIKDQNDTVNGTQNPVDLIVLRNRSGGRLRASELVYYSASPGCMMKRVAGHSGTGFRTGQYSVCVDDAYTSSIAANELFYGVWQGPVKIKTSRTGTTFLVNETITSDNHGRIVPKTSFNHDSLGVIDRAVSSALSTRTVLCYVGPRYKRGDGA